ncbi:glycosyl transferase [Nocardioides baekrokdamisoli]|uniref:Glycosyl transferase n=1 Tax=Nocardioides baekrokdamisoli TaxID=1804624 RepID=A0A3G9IXJ0_9ACTN|nr:glycosyltransferase family 2 protein [Nocardioides baekrokdamisoli]BBH17113.1 glycosyl transferase [Nocardioides baekrokdamisoli]
MREVGAVVVHHRHFPDVLDTVGDILESGVLPEHLVLVDNSEDAGLASDLRRLLPSAVRLVTVPNRGYGAAVNTGTRLLMDLGLRYALVATHEVRFADGALDRLSRTLVERPRAAAVGPILRQGALDGPLWSAGGGFTRILGLPRHYRQSLGGAHVVARDWLDGAAVMYRLDAYGAGMSEAFFMYVEELEFHVRLRAGGWEVLSVPGAVASQTTNGTPAYYQARNLQMFYSRWAGWLRRTFSVPALIVRNVLSNLLRGNGIGPVRDAIRGWREARSTGSDWSAL